MLAAAGVVRNLRRRCPYPAFAAPAAKSVALRYISKKKATKQQQSAPAEPAGPKEVTIPVNYLKDGKDPVLMTNEHYPEWLRSLTLQNLTELNTKGYENLTLEEERRYWQLMSRRKIKDNNSTTTL